MRVVNLVFVSAWYVVCGILLAIWVPTIAQLGFAGLTSFVAMVLLIPLLFMVEGLELAVAALLGRSTILVGSADKELRRIQADRQFSFFPNRQVFVVASIVLLTLANSFDSIYVPWFGWTSDHLATRAFNMAFSTLTVLLIAQIPPKLLALHQPQRFYAHTWMICTAVRWVGYVKVTDPADAIMRLISKILRYPVVTQQAPPNSALVYDPNDGWLVMQPESPR